jgi:hypothetical protein
LYVDFQKEKSLKGQDRREGAGFLTKQKAFNKVLAKERVVVEHTKCRVKKFHIFGEEVRNRLKRYT